MDRVQGKFEICVTYDLIRIIGIVVLIKIRVNQKPSERLYA